MVNVDGLTDGSKVFAKDVVLPEGVCSTSRIRKSPVVTVEVPEDAADEAAPVETAPAENAE